MSGVMLLVGPCFNCGVRFTACPDCVNTMRVDPETGLPPDVRIVDGLPVHVADPDPAATARSEKEPVCDACIVRRNATSGGHVMTSAERHERHHAQFHMEIE